MENNFSVARTSNQLIKEVYNVNIYEQLTNISLDYSVLGSLKEFFQESDGINDFVLIVTTYLQETTQKLNELKEVITKKDTNRLKLMAHGLKGISATLGVLRFSRLCSDLEKIAQNQLFEEAKPILVQAQEEFNYIRILLLRNMATLNH